MRQEEWRGLPSVDCADIRLSAFGMGEMSRVNSGVDGFTAAINNLEVAGAIQHPQGCRRNPGHTPNARSCGLYIPATRCVQAIADASTARSQGAKEPRIQGAVPPRTDESKARSQGAVPPRADDPKERSRGGVPPRADTSKALSQGDFHQATMLRWPLGIVIHCI